MSGSGNGITNAHCVTAFAVTTCNGYAFKYDCINGSEGIRNDLNGLGKGETRIAYDSHREIYYFGSNGHVQGVKMDDFTSTIWAHPVNLSNALDTVTSVVVAAASRRRARVSVTGGLRAGRRRRAPPSG